jgi:hypothetical protein
MTSKCFKKRRVPQEKDELGKNPVQEVMTWEKKIEQMVGQGYSYEVAYAIISRRRIQELFDKDAKVNCLQ